MELTSKIRTVRSLSGKAEGQRRNKKAKVKSSAPAFNGHGFLKHRFLPLSDAPQGFVRSSLVVEREFFNSLSNLAASYGFNPLNVVGKVYPDNIRCAYHHAVLQLKAVCNLPLIIVQDINHKCCLATVKSLNNIAQTLFYIPVKPLWNLLVDGKQKQAAKLFLSVFCYLYKVVQIPYYRDNSSYLYGTYEMMDEWIKDNQSDYEREDFECMVANLDALNCCGDLVKRKISNPYHLRQFEKRVAGFEPSNDWEEKLHHLSGRFFQLYTSFPNATLFDNIHERLLEPNEDERIYPEQYVSFFWDYNDSLYESLFETVNSDLQEKSVMDEPLAVQFFDTPQVNTNGASLEFEQSLFELLPDLIDLL